MLFTRLVDESGAMLWGRTTNSHHIAGDLRVGVQKRALIHRRSIAASLRRPGRWCGTARCISVLSGAPGQQG